MFATFPTPAFVPTDLAGRFALILDLLRRTAAAKLASNRAASPMLVLLWSHLHRLSARFASLVARSDAGTLRPPRPTRPQAARATPRPRLPKGFAWLTQLVPETNVCGSQLQHFLSQPDMIALLEAEPRFGRLLRPLCRMLAIPSPVSPPRQTAATATPQNQPAGGSDRHTPEPARSPPPALPRPATQG